MNISYNDFLNMPLLIFGGGEWLDDPQMISRSFGYGDVKTDWTKIFDGIMYIGEMFPSTSINTLYRTKKNVF